MFLFRNYLFRPPRLDDEWLYRDAVANEEWALGYGLDPSQDLPSVVKSIAFEAYGSVDRYVGQRISDATLLGFFNFWNRDQNNSLYLSGGVASNRIGGYSGARLLAGAMSIAFQHLKVEYLRCEVREQNTASARLLTAFGFEVDPCPPGVSELRFSARWDFRPTTASLHALRNL